MQTIGDAEDPLALREASIIASHSAREAAIGFSQSTCLPDCSARIVCSACIEIGQHYVDDIDSAVVFNSLEVLVPVDGLCIDAVGAGNLAGLLGVLG